MSIRHRIILTLIVVGSCQFSATGVWGQSWKSKVGFDDLVAEKGDSLEDGAGVTVAHVEARSGGNYLPDITHPQFSGKTITDMSGLASGSSGHATGVGTLLYGNTISMTGGITTIGAYDADDYINRVLGLVSGADPLDERFDISNHSYVGSGESDAEDVDILQRFDFVINRDDAVAVVGANNGSSRPTPHLLAPSYNAITVGRSDGNHSRGMTSVYGVGRFKPDIVAPQGSSSAATPTVGTAAALLKSAGAGTNAARNEVIKSMLFAGATKEEFSDWDRTTTRPIDEVYGFGELNIFNSYHIFEGGEFDGVTTDPTVNVELTGWDYGSFDGVNKLFYDFSVLADQSKLSAALVWNIEVTDTNPDPNIFSATTALANLDLELFDSTGSFLGTLVDSSLSTVYNLEHLYTTDLAAGDYTFRISGDSAVNFGFSWQISSVPEPSAFVLTALVVVGMVSRRQRQTDSRG